jgi:hypothetical protein
MYQKNWIEKTVYLLKLAVKSPSLSPPIPSAFTPYPLFQWYPQSKKLLLNLSITIVVVQVGAVKINVGAVEALRKKERLFFRFLKNFTPCMTKLRVVVLCFSYFTDNSKMYGLILPKEHYKPKPCKLDKYTSCWKAFKKCVHALGPHSWLFFHYYGKLTTLNWWVKNPWKGKASLLTTLLQSFKSVCMQKAVSSLKSSQDTQSLHLELAIFTSFFFLMIDRLCHHS